MDRSYETLRYRHRGTAKQTQDPSGCTSILLLRVLGLLLRVEGLMGGCYRVMGFGFRASACPGLGVHGIAGFKDLGFGFETCWLFPESMSSGTLALSTALPACLNQRSWCRVSRS